MNDLFADLEIDPLVKDVNYIVHAHENNQVYLDPKLFQVEKGIYSMQEMYGTLHQLNSVTALIPSKSSGPSSSR